MPRGRKPEKVGKYLALGRALRRARQRVEPESGNRFAERLGWPQSKVSRLEGGHQLPSEADLDQWAAETGADPGELREARRRVLVRDLDIRAAALEPGGVEALQGELGELEAESTLLAEYQPLVIPGLAQTPDYTRAWLNQPGRPSLAAELDVEQIVLRRLRRQQRAREEGKWIVVAINEAALQATYGTPEVQAEQVQRLHDLAAAGEVELLVEPLNRPTALLHGYELLDDAVVVETVYGARIMADPDVVDRFAQHLQHLREAHA